MTQKNFIKSPELSKEILKILFALIDEGKSEIQESKSNNDVLIFNLRKRVKKLRAYLKLLRKEFGEEFYKKNNFLLRDINRRSAPLRNGYALIKLIESSKLEIDDKNLLEALDLLNLRLQSDFNNIQANTDYKTLFSHYSMQLDKFADHLKKNCKSENRFGVIKSGLTKIYSEGFDLGKECTKKPTNENLHEWRKSIKDLYYVLFSLTPIWEPMFLAYTKELKLLSKKLGKINDYFELKHYIQTLVDSPFDFTNVIGFIETQHNKLLNDSYALGIKIYSISPEIFAELIKSYYLIFKKES